MSSDRERLVPVGVYGVVTEIVKHIVPQLHSRCRQYSASLLLTISPQCCQNAFDFPFIEDG